MDNISEILNWYIQSGVDALCADSPINVIPTNQTAKDKANSTLISDSQNIRPATTILAQTNSTACINAREVCAEAKTLEELKNILENFEGCALKLTANSTVFGYGSNSATVMIVGEAPGADEDRIGKPFVGKSGQLLDKMLQSVGLNREECYITNVLPWRPPGNRTPTDGEVAVCLPFLRRQIEIIKPKILLLLGGNAANALLNNAESISHLRGHFLEYKTDDGENIATIASFHPAYLLRNPAQKAKSWSDLLRLNRKLKEL